MCVPTSASSFKPWYPRRLPFLAASDVRAHLSGAAGARARLTRLPFRRQPPAQGREGCWKPGCPGSSGQKAVKERGTDRGAELAPELCSRLPRAPCHTLRRCRNQLARGADGARAEAGGTGGWVAASSCAVPARQTEP